MPHTPLDATKVLDAHADRRSYPSHLLVDQTCVCVRVWHKRDPSKSVYVHALVSVALVARNV